MFHRYVQRDINSSHLLHKAHSAGDSPGDTGAWGQRGHILYTELKHTCFNPLQKKEKGIVEETEGTGGRKRRIRREWKGVRYLDSYSNTKEHVQIV